ncbi:hypothetical protein H696_00820 [Fonticula alba]|uniref:COX assembly mitochondrial protein n=1 Tax=Fonticula alba TaxID=691883 RepID=A0A058ZH63_FONAL|nr:hypothetical protein H696_00820 [Fonticula alba]KCV73278.1 hypothetical protein H696_00820 [Fonticula alba]|eukprot:XP_009492979.1 hypothetical protein H696_00820 [Fonticula alba]
MHPNLDSYKFDYCAEVINALQECHRTHRLKRFFGVCTPLKESLSECLTQDYRMKQAENSAKARAKKEKMRKFNEELGI